MSESAGTPPWLPPELAAWVVKHMAVLEAIYAAFERDGHWPAPGGLQRELLAAGRRVRVVSAVDAMPPVLGSRTHAPDEVRLSLFGLGCVPAARGLLEHYVAVLRLARNRYAQPGEVPRISRADVAEQLGLDERALDRLSVVLLADPAFLGGGQADVAAWELDIDDRVIDFDGIEDPDALLAFLADQRRLGRPALAAFPAKPADTASVAAAAMTPPPDELGPLRGAVGAGVPVAALETYARWWQLETFLRELVYVELRARWGEAWTDHLSGTAPKRAARDDVNAYMASADAGELLAYADVSDLFRLIDDQWDLFAPVLPPRERWAGTAHLLRDVRNRNAHCRRPHRDDPARLRQTLRDLDAGARRFYASYLRTSAPPPKSRDKLARAWIRGQHPAAARLLEHAERQYDVRFQLRYSTRPWASPPTINGISGTPGALWHAEWLIGAREVPILELWQRLHRGGLQQRLVHLLHGGATITATFPAIDAPDATADAIGDLFDALLTVSRPLPSTGDFSEPVERWRTGADQLPRRVQVDTPLALHDYDLPFSLFGAE